MKLRLKHAMQENDYYFHGFLDLRELADAFADYPFDSEALEKARIHRNDMERSMPVLSVSIRMNPDTKLSWEGEDLLCEGADWEIRDGKSRVAALRGLDSYLLEGGFARARIFRTTKEHLARLEQNLI